MPENPQLQPREETGIEESTALRPQGAATELRMPSIVLGQSGAYDTDVHWRESYVVAEAKKMDGLIKQNNSSST